MPFFVLTYIYTRIISELARHRIVQLVTVTKNEQKRQYDDETNSLNGGLSSSNDHQQSYSFLACKRFEQKRLNTVIICVVTVAFFACQFPVRIIQLIDMYLRIRNEEVMPYIVWIWLWKLSKLLFFLNFTANPVMTNKYSLFCLSNLHFYLDNIQYFINEVSSFMSSFISNSSFIEF